MQPGEKKIEPVCYRLDAISQKKTTPREHMLTNAPQALSKPWAQAP